MEKAKKGTSFIFWIFIAYLLIKGLTTYRNQPKPAQLNVPDRGWTLKPPGEKRDDHQWRQELERQLLKEEVARKQQRDHERMKHEIAQEQQWELERMKQEIDRQQSELECIRRQQEWDRIWDRR